MGAPHYTVALQKIAAEQGLTVLHAAQDYATREEAANALKSAGARNEKWDQEDKEWEDWDDDGEPDED